jgi:hypothetical protein
MSRTDRSFLRTIATRARTSAVTPKSVRRKGMLFGWAFTRVLKYTGFRTAKVA